MSRLLIRQKVFSWTDTYNVYDGEGNPKYYVKADLFSIGHRIRVFDHEGGKELGMIQEKVLRLLKEYEIFINGYSQGTIKQQISLFHPKYNIDYKGWRLEGDFPEWNYDVYDRSRCVLHITKELFRWGDTYVLQIGEDADELPALMVAIAMDAAKCGSDNQRNSFV